MGAAQSDLTHALRRIDKLEAARRRVLRTLNRCTPGCDLARDLSQQKAELDTQIGYWRSVVRRAEAEGLKVWGPDDFSRGDFVGYRGDWHKILRVNRRSVTIPYNGGTWTVGYHDGITGRMSAEQAADFRTEPGPKDHER